ncbi:deubiquitination-protection protein dph1 [Gaeumannomyces tritici R3-111a-1]|uniref:Deubiquitination-protection protein dph1 n=1 Tax=Gaeumannomyces tritici (strain R3-111a-1) TaxID=644352 RepID=J3NHT3_GAET3|nr:deubiquitination-protection protein dph1 [Gaeumannomyces tritici R3-111a-1]EJT80826.1 deubiquitination-protection protein dph1 [Gaeumannomyces tritici R3-111a-1]
MADAPEETGDAQLSFKVKTSGEGSHNIAISESATVLDLKNKLAAEEFENIPADRQRLIYSGRVMKNDDALSTYKIKTGNTIHLVKSAASNPSRPAQTSAAAAVPAVPTNMAAGTSASNPLAGLTGARYAGHVPLPSADLFGPDGGMNPPSEEQMAEMLSNPAIQQSMNEALQNPDFVNFMIQSNPMLRNLPNAREIVQSPQFRHMMTDAESLRMASRMRRMFGGPGGAGAGAFPAPGATSTTPDGAPASTGTEGGAGAGANAGAQGVPPMPFGLPGMFGMPQGGDAAANPFAALFAPAAGQQAPGAGAGQGNNTATSGGAAAGQAPGADPLAALFGGGAGAGGPGGNPFASPEFQQFMQAMQAGGGGLGAAPAAPPDNRPPEERYAEQLRQLNDMGFFDFDRNVAALRRSGGSVQGAIEHLLSG